MGNRVRQVFGGQDFVFGCPKFDHNSGAGLKDGVARPLKLIKNLRRPIGKRDGVFYAIAGFQCILNHGSGDRSGQYACKGRIIRATKRSTRSAARQSACPNAYAGVKTNIDGMLGNHRAKFYLGRLARIVRTNIINASGNTGRKRDSHRQ